MQHATIGIDVSKDHLDLHRLPDAASVRFPNTRSGLAQLVAWIGCDVGRIVFEATGRYHRSLERRLAEAGYPAVKLNPKRARRFAEAIGTAAKTDRADAAMLARMGQALALEPQPVRPENVLKLNELLSARRALVKDRTAARNRAGDYALDLLRRLVETRLAQIAADIAAIDAACAKLIAADPDLAARHRVLTSIPGIATATAATIVALLPELGHAEHRQIAHLAGVAPIDRQSGTWRGVAHIRGGRAPLRHALYMPTLVAIQRNAEMKAIYERLVARGKPKKVAIVAIMRKLLILANALLRDNRKWTPMAP